jgi:hypothetical protein
MARKKITWITLKIFDRIIEKVLVIHGLRLQLLKTKQIVDYQNQYEIRNLLANFSLTKQMEENSMSAFNTQLFTY